MQVTISVWVIFVAIGGLAVMGIALAVDFRRHRRRLFLAGTRFGSRQAFLSIQRGIGSDCDTAQGQIHMAMEKALADIETSPLGGSRDGDWVLELTPSPEFLDGRIAAELSALGELGDERAFNEFWPSFLELKAVGEAMGHACRDNGREQVSTQKA